MITHCVVVFLWQDYLRQVQFAHRNEMKEGSGNHNKNAVKTVFLLWQIQTSIVSKIIKK